MATKGAQAGQDSTDSDDSMAGRPDFSAEERELLDDLLESSTKLIRLYEDHQPELEQIINRLFGNTEVYLDDVITKAKGSRAWRTTVFSGPEHEFRAAHVLLGPSTDGASSSTLMTAERAGAVAVGETRDRGNLNKQEVKKRLEEIEKDLKKFNTTVDIVTSPLNNICNNVEKILQYQNDEHYSWLQCELEGVKKHGDAISELAELYKSEDLQKVLDQGQRTLATATNSTFINALHFVFSFMLNPFVFLISGLTTAFKFLVGAFKSEDYKTLTDFNKLRNQATVQENELESEAGKFAYKMRETLNHIQNTLNELRSSKSEVEVVIMPNLNECLKQRETD